VPVRLGWLDHAEPRLGRILAEAGAAPVVVPLLLAAGYHALVDIPAIAAASRTPGTTLAAAIGAHPAVIGAVENRLAEAGASPGAPVVLAATGSTDPAAAADVKRAADELAARRGRPVTVGFAATGNPDLAAAVRRAAASGRPIAVASYLIGPGRFADLIRDAAAGAGATWVAAPLGAQPGMARALLDRYLEACAD